MSTSPCVPGRLWSQFVYAGNEYSGRSDLFVKDTGVYMVGKPIVQADGQQTL